MPASLYFCLLEQLQQQQYYNARHAQYTDYQCRKERYGDAYAYCRAEKIDYKQYRGAYKRINEQFPEYLQRYFQHLACKPQYAESQQQSNYNAHISPGIAPVTRRFALA